MARHLGGDGLLHPRVRTLRSVDHDRRRLATPRLRKALEVSLARSEQSDCVPREHGLRILDPRRRPLAVWSQPRDRRLAAGLQPTTRLGLRPIREGSEGEFGELPCTEVQVGFIDREHSSPSQQPTPRLRSRRGRRCCTRPQTRAAFHRRSNGRRIAAPCLRAAHRAAATGVGTLLGDSGDRQPASPGSPCAGSCNPTASQ